MTVRKLKPVTPAQRFTIVNGFDAITVSKPEKSLLRFLKKTGGRNNSGKMTVPHREEVIKEDIEKLILKKQI